MTATGAEIYCKICVVDAVDEKARTVDVSPLDESAPILGVNLQANQGGEAGLVAFPAKGSHVVVAFLNDAAAVVVLSEQADKVCGIVGGDTPVKLTAESNSLTVSVGDTEITADGKKHITFNGGSLGGLIAIQKLTDKINELVDAFNGHTHTLMSGLVQVAPTPNGIMNGNAITVPAIMSKAEKLKKSDYENENIKHG